MYEGLSSPTIHTPKTLSEYNNVMLHTENTTIWAGGTYLMTRADAYPAKNGGIENIVYLGEIEELKKYQRNDRVAEFGAMITLYEIINAAKNVLPKILIDNIRSIGSPVITRRATIGGAISLPDLSSSFLGTLIALNANIEIRYPKKKRMHSKWLPASRLVDKNNHLTLPPNGLISKVRINISETLYQRFFSSGNIIQNPKNSVAISFVSSWAQDTLLNTHFVLTLPSLGLCFSRDIDNIFTSLRFPLSEDEYASLIGVLFSFIEASFQITSLQRSMIRAFLEGLVDELNQKALTLPAEDQN